MSFIQIIKKARLEERAKNYARAFNLYNLAIENCQKELILVKIAARKSWCLEQVGNHRESEKLISDLTILYPNEPESYLQSAIYYVRMKKWKLAKNYLKQGIEQFPSFLEFYLTLSFILKDTDRSNESIEVLKKALIQKNLSNGRGGITRKDIWAELGNLYFERGNYNSCIVSLKKSLRMESEESQFLFFDVLALSYLKINDPENALKYINLHLEYFSERDPEDFILKAKAHSRLQDYHLASASILQAYNEDGDLRLKTEDMQDFSFLIQNGFFDSIENVIIEDD